MTFKSLMRTSGTLLAVLILASCASQTPEPDAQAKVLAPAVQGSDILEVRVYNIGSGMCASVMCPGSNDWYLVDCGSSASGDGGDVPFNIINQDLKRIAGVNSVNAQPHVVMTHGDRDHINKVNTVMAGVPLAAQIFLGGAPSQYTDESFKTWLAPQTAPIHYGKDIGSLVNQPNQLYGTDLQCGTANAYLLAAHTDTNKNESSLFTVFKYGSTTYLFTGDATGPTQVTATTKLNNSTLGLDATTRYLVAPHHGGDTHQSNDKAFAEAVYPSAVVFSSNGKRYGHPRCTSVENYYNAASAALRNVGKHDLTCGLGNNQYQTFTPSTALFGTSDSGTMVFTQSDSVSVPQIKCLDSQLNPTPCTTP